MKYYTISEETFKEVKKLLKNNKRMIKFYQNYIKDIDKIEKPSSRVNEIPKPPVYESDLAKDFLQSIADKVNLNTKLANAEARINGLEALNSKLEEVAGKYDEDTDAVIQKYKDDIMKLETRISEYKDVIADQDKEIYNMHKEIESLKSKYASDPVLVISKSNGFHYVKVGNHSPNIISKDFFDVLKSRGKRVGGIIVNVSTEPLHPYSPIFGIDDVIYSCSRSLYRELLKYNGRFLKIQYVGVEANKVDEMV